jgi:hypothetical protein
MVFVIFVGLPRVSLRGQRDIGCSGRGQLPLSTGAGKADKSSHEGPRWPGITVAGQVVAADTKTRHLCAPIDILARPR